MADAPKPGEQAKDKDDQPAPEAGSNWTSSVAVWLAGALAAVGSALLAKVGFDQLGKGSVGSTFLACLALGVGLLGVVLVIGALAASRVPLRTPLGWLTSRQPFARTIRKNIETENDYLLSGRQNIGALQTELDTLLDEQFAGTSADPYVELSPSKKRQLRNALDTKDLIVSFARDRLDVLVFRFWLFLALVGALLAGAGFAAFVGISQYGSEDQKRQDTKEALVAGPLVPKTPSEVTVKLLRSVGRGDAKVDELTKQAGPSCPVFDGIDALALELGTPPAGTPSEAVFHVTSVRSEECGTVDMWVTPAELRPREEKKPATPSTSTPAPSTAPTTTSS